MGCLECGPLDLVDGFRGPTVVGVFQRADLCDDLVDLVRMASAPGRADGPDNESKLTLTWKSSRKPM
jgi:hypothetical protein